MHGSYNSKKDERNKNTEKYEEFCKNCFNTFSMNV